MLNWSGPGAFFVALKPFDRYSAGHGFYPGPGLTRLADKYTPAGQYLL
ncbi:hypothetical protein ADIAL_0206 [Alkalibacterium sp. AK22]|nr:hypothetical protein ADIAL_0206 [Alkalibacterium sp. AK22]